MSHPIKPTADEVVKPKGLYQKLRFVFIQNYPGMKNTVLASTDLAIGGIYIIDLYSHRAKIECFFREFKQQFGGYFCHFWSSCLEKYDHFAKKEDASPMDNVKEKDQQKVVKATRRIEGHVIFAGIAMGIAQMIALIPEFVKKIKASRFIRKPEGIHKGSGEESVSEASVLYYLRANFFRLLMENPELETTKHIILCRGKYKPEAA